MKFTPRSEEEVKRIFDKGIYKFKVESAKEKVSKTGKPMIQLDLTLFHNNITGKTVKANCFLMTSEPNFEFLIRHFCYSTGLQDDYNAGELTSNRAVGKTGLAKVGVEIDQTGTYPDKNRILDFIFDENNIKSDTPKDLNDSLEDINF